MADYKGSQGIAALKAKINLKSKTLVGEAAEKIAINLVDESPLGAEYYASPTLDRNIKNDVGDYKNSWVVEFNYKSKVVRSADPSGTGAVLDAMSKASAYNLQDVVYITNFTPQAKPVEEGWEDNPEYGWKAKGGYHVVGNNTGTAVAILEAVANKVSKM